MSERIEVFEEVTERLYGQSNGFSLICRSEYVHYCVNHWRADWHPSYWQGQCQDEYRYIYTYIYLYLRGVWQYLSPYGIIIYEENERKVTLYIVSEPNQPEIPAFVASSSFIRDKTAKRHVRAICSSPTPSAIYYRLGCRR